MISKTFNTIADTEYEFSMDDITTYSQPTSPGGEISLFVTYYDYTVRVYKDSSTTPFYTTQFNLANATRVLDFVTDATTTQIRIEISKGMVMTQGQGKYVDNLKLRKFTGNTSVYSTNYSNMSITANALDGWAPDNWATTSATVDQAAGQYRLVAIGTGATAKVQREFTAMPNQEHRFQYNLSLLNGGSTTVRVEQKVNGVYQYLATQQTQTSSGTYELSFVPNYEDIRISVSGTSRYALNNLYLDHDQIDTLVSTYALSRGYRYGFQAQEKDDEVKGRGNSYTTEFRQYDSRIGRWLSIDPLARCFPHQSPYVGIDNNPIYLRDPNGDSTFVSKIGDGKYKVIGGNTAGDHNGIFIKNNDGSIGEMIGYSLAPESFYNPEDNEWMGTINVNDQSGRDFLNENTRNVPELFHYIGNAGNNKKYDFKASNGTSEVKYESNEDYYRGMLLMGQVNGQRIFVSARDVGNLLAGYVAAYNGIDPLLTRIGFDAYQSYRSGELSSEHSSSKIPQAIGYVLGNITLYNKLIEHYGGLPSYPPSKKTNEMPKAILGKNKGLKAFY